MIELKALFTFQIDFRLLTDEPLVDFPPEVSSIRIHTKRLLIVALLFVGVTAASVEIRSGEICNRVARFRCDCPIKIRQRPIEITQREVAQSSGHEPVRPRWAAAHGLIKIP